MMETITNNYGIRYKVCCASCENRVLEVDGSYCGSGKSKPKFNQPCKSYKFRPSLTDTGKEKGRIKKPDYFRFLTELRDRETMKRTPISERAGLTEIRASYEKMYGSIYLTN